MTRIPLASVQSWEHRNLVPVMLQVILHLRHQAQHDTGSASHLVCRDQQSSFTLVTEGATECKGSYAPPKQIGPHTHRQCH